MNKLTLIAQNRQFEGTRGTSQYAGPTFRPAFLDKHTGRVEIARYFGGKPAPVHVISGLPRAWAEQLDESGAVAALRDGIIAGFESDGVFYTRDAMTGL